MTEITRLPLPEPLAWLEQVTISSGNSSGPTKEWRVTRNPSTSNAPRKNLYTADQMHQYADAENAALQQALTRRLALANGLVEQVNALSDDNTELIHQTDDLRKKNAELQERVNLLEDALRDIAYTTDGVDCNAHARAALEAAK